MHSLLFLSEYLLWLFYSNWLVIILIMLIMTCSSGWLAVYVLVILAAHSANLLFTFLSHLIFHFSCNSRVPVNSAREQVICSICSRNRTKLLNVPGVVYRSAFWVKSGALQFTACHENKAKSLSNSSVSEGQMIYFSHDSSFCNWFNKLLHTQQQTNVNPLPNRVKK